MRVFDRARVELIVGRKVSMNELFSQTPLKRPEDLQAHEKGMTVTKGELVSGQAKIDAMRAQHEQVKEMRAKKQTTKQRHDTQDQAFESLIAAEEQKLNPPPEKQPLSDEQKQKLATAQNAYEEAYWGAYPRSVVLAAERALDIAAAGGDPSEQLTITYAAIDARYAERMQSIDTDRRKLESERLALRGEAVKPVEPTPKPVRDTAMDDLADSAAFLRERKDWWEKWEADKAAEAKSDAIAEAINQ